MFILREVFHYGRDRSETDLPIDGEPNPFSLTEALAGSLYVNPVSNPDTPKAIRNLLDGKEGELGWCRYTIVSIDKD